MDLLDSIKQGSTRLALRMIRDMLIDLQYRDDEGNTYLHHSVIADDPRICYELLSRGASLTATNKYGETPYQLARDLYTERNGRQDADNRVLVVLEAAGAGEIINDD